MKFYKNLYTEQNLSTIDLEDHFENITVPKLTENEKLSLEGALTKEELAEALKNMKNEKSPGPDGFTTEFLKFFWKDFGNFLLRSINHGYKHGRLSITQTQGLITCIPKSNKIRDLSLF